MTAAGLSHAAAAATPPSDADGRLREVGAATARAGRGGWPMGRRGWGADDGERGAGDRGLARQRGAPDGGRGDADFDGILLPAQARNFPPRLSYKSVFHSLTVRRRTGARSLV
jgi:hypothetical protein